MKKRFWLSKRRGIFYLVDSITEKKESLRTHSRAEAQKIQVLRNQAAEQPSLNLALGKAFITAHDQNMSKRTWALVMDEFCRSHTESTAKRNKKAVESKSIRMLRDKKIIETTADDFLAVIRAGTVSTPHFLKRLQNLAISLGWLPWPILNKMLWRKHEKKKETKRGITFEEHQRMLAAEHNPEWRLYYEMIWEIGAAQSDAASLRADDIDWETRTLSLSRCKTDATAVLTIGVRLETLLRQLPRSGFLFPTIALQNASVRAWHFNKARKRVGLPKEVTLHSYRYAWAERAKAAGMPERFAMQALGHNSKAVHRAYAKRALVQVPSIEEYEKQMREKIVPLAPEITDTQKRA